MFIDRSGVKASLLEKYSRHSSGSLSLVLEQVCARACAPLQLDKMERLLILLGLAP